MFQIANNQSSKWNLLSFKPSRAENRTTQSTSSISKSSQSSAGRLRVLVLVHNGGIASGDNGCHLRFQVAQAKKDSGELAFDSYDLELPTRLEKYSCSTPSIAIDGTAIGSGYVVSTGCSDAEGKENIAYLRINPQFTPATFHVVSDAFTDFPISLVGSEKRASIAYLNQSKTTVLRDKHQQVHLNQDLPELQNKLTITWARGDPKDEMAVYSSTPAFILKERVQHGHVYAFFAHSENQNSHALSMQVALLASAFYERTPPEQHAFWDVHTVEDRVRTLMRPSAVWDGKKAIHVIYCGADCGLYYFCIDLNSQGLPKSSVRGAKFEAQGLVLLPGTQGKVKYSPVIAILGQYLYVFMHSNKGDQLIYFHRPKESTEWTQGPDTNIQLRSEDGWGGVSVALQEHYYDPDT